MCYYHPTILCSLPTKTYLTSDIFFQIHIGLIISEFRQFDLADLNTHSASYGFRQIGMRRPAKNPQIGSRSLFRISTIHLLNFAQFNFVSRKIGISLTKLILSWCCNVVIAWLALVTRESYETFSEWSCLDWKKNRFFRVYTQHLFKSSSFELHEWIWEGIETWNDII